MLFGEQGLVLRLRGGFLDMAFATMSSAGIWDIEPEGYCLPVRIRSWCTQASTSEWAPWFQEIGHAKGIFRSLSSWLLLSAYNPSLP